MLPERQWLEREAVIELHRHRHRSRTKLPPLQSRYCRQLLCTGSSELNCNRLLEIGNLIQSVLEILSSQSDSEQICPENSREITGKISENSKMWGYEPGILEHVPRDFTRISRVDSGRNCSESDWVQFSIQWNCKLCLASLISFYVNKKSKFEHFQAKILKKVAYFVGKCSSNLSNLNDFPPVYVKIYIHIFDY